jgi:hypothetical protein
MEDDHDEDMYEEEVPCPICGARDTDCEHHVATLNKTEGTFSGGPACPGADALWDALSDAMTRAAAGGKINGGKAPGIVESLLKEAQEFGSTSNNPEDAPAELYSSLIDVIDEIAEKPGGTIGRSAIEHYGGFPSEDAVTLYWSRDPRRYADYIIKCVELISISVE